MNKEKIKGIQDYIEKGTGKSMLEIVCESMAMMQEQLDELKARVDLLERLSR